MYAYISRYREKRIFRCDFFFLRFWSVWKVWKQILSVSKQDISTSRMEKVSMLSLELILTERQI